MTRGAWIGGAAWLVTLAVGSAMGQEGGAAADSAAVDTTAAVAPAPQPAAADTSAVPHFEPIEDRWRDIVPPPYELNVDGHWYDPYNRNVLKGDYPIAGQNTFLVLTGKLDNKVELASAPTPSGISTKDPQSPEFFGGSSRMFYNGIAALTLELYHGQTAFRPRDWELKATVAGNLNHLSVAENNNVHINVRKGATRSDNHLAVQELSFEKHLLDWNKRYDFFSLRVGIQKFGSDFRDLIFRDYQLGARFLGNAENNRWQYNLAFFDLLEKDTNSELNTFDSRGQQVLIANIYRQDTFTKGYTTQFSLHLNRDHGEVHTNTNGVPVRPPAIGFVTTPQKLDTMYLGWTGDGHFGRINVNHAFYYVTGTDERNPIADQEVSVGAYLASLELSIDVDWQRYKVTALVASGDSDPLDDKAGGFDAIVEEPFLAGGPFSWWNGQEVRLQGVNLVNKRSFFPTLKGATKFEAQANHVNPGLLLVGVGHDAELTPKLKSLINLTYLGFMDTTVLDHVLNQPGIGSPIGIDASLGLIWRPLLNNNVIVTLNGAALLPLGGFNDIYESPGLQMQTLAGLTLVY